MISRIIDVSLSNRIPTLSVVCAILGFGIWSWSNLKKEAYPDVGDTQVIVIAQFPGKAASEVEEKVTLPLERGLNSVPYVLTRRSKTIFGLSVLQYVFEERIGDLTARQLVMERLKSIDLPEEAHVSLGPMTSPVSEIYRYVIEAPEDWSPMELRTLQDWVIVPSLLQVPGVVDVVNFGGLEKQYHVITSPNRLNRYQLTLSDVIEALKSNNRNTGGNVFTRGDQGFPVRGLGAIRNKEDIRNIVVTAISGTPVYVGNLASVEEYPRRPDGIFHYALRDSVTGEFKSKDSGIQGLVAIRRGENPSEVIERLREKIRQINSDMLPEGIKLTATYDRSELVNYTVRTVRTTLFEGVSIVILVLVFFLGNVRTAIVVACTIPISLLFGFGMMRLTGIPANLLSLGAIDFGIIVDGAVVMAENIYRKYSSVKKEQGLVPFPELLRITRSSAKEVGNEIFFAIAIIIFAYLPIFTFQRIEGRLFSPMAFTLSFSLLGSLLLTITLIPVIMCFLFRSRMEDGSDSEMHWKNPVLEKMKSGYEFLVRKGLSDTKRTVYFIAISVGIISTIGYSKLGTDFLPELDEGSITIRCFLPTGIGLRSAEKQLSVVRNTLLKHDPVVSVLNQLGRNDEGTDPYGPNRLEILVGLKDYSLWKEKITKKELVQRIKNDLQENLPGTLFVFSQPILDNVTEAMTGSVSDLAILIDGEDLTVLRSVAKRILSVIQEIPGATESGIEQEGNQAQLTVIVDRRNSARYGINAADILNTVEAAVGGTEAGILYQGSRRFDIVVRYPIEYRSSFESLRNLTVFSPTGGRIPLHEVASLELKDGPTVIQRQDGKRQISVRTNIRGRDQGGFVQEAKKRVAETVSVPEKVSLRWGGQFENLTRAGERLSIVIPATLLGIYLFLLGIYGKIRYALLALSGVPLSVAGGILALVFTGTNFSVSAGVGFVSLFGISTMTCVLFVSRTLRFQEESNGSDLKTSVLAAANLQFSPRLMTILLAMFGLLPAALATGIGSDVQRPLATVIVGGLAMELLSLVFLPCLFCLTDREGLKKEVSEVRL
ncbi:efflux RND transporter permease subunit [Leptospira fluminis]|uniref:Efflux RND transporter permease subunit n=1 Tax=Leptospira fluminis TaxID=2484979 RepID=A0A4R9GLG6_9LEPT|nr:CusA/CzcA family heavy metal efflux RND transporter [Leptospira fluminis]TGK15630.1 efflux RND transporter permease subunit [Leptospira fluminis]